jgi:hypothetical protein
MLSKTLSAAAVIWMVLPCCAFSIDKTKCMIDAQANWPRMELLVIDSAGQPVPDAKVTGRINIGKSCLDNMDFPYTTDANGIAMITVPNQSKGYLRIEASKKGMR